MRKRFLILVMVALFVFPSFVFAQGQVAIESVNVGLWPEYDKAAMLVISYIMLSEDTKLPAQVDVRIPSDAALHTVAIGASSDVVSDQGVEKTTKIDGDWLVISVNATGPAIQLEYYDPGLKKKGDRRSFLYRWLSDYDVANFGVLFQQPFDSEGFKSSLPLQDDGVHSDDMQYYFSRVGAVPAGEVLTFDLSYQKATDSLSVSRMGIKPVTIDENTPGRISLNDYVPYMIGGFGLVMIVGGVLYYRHSGRFTSSKKSRRKRADRDEAESGVYCAQCGTRARGGDRFCRTCGSRLRQAEE